MVRALELLPWTHFMEWVEVEEKQVIAEMRKATPEGLMNLQGKLQNLEQLRKLKDSVERDNAIMKEETPNG